MTITQTLLLAFNFLRAPCLNSRKFSSVLACGLVGGLVLPTGLLASETNDALPTSVSDVALLQPSGTPSPTEIRMKLHSVEDLRIRPKKAMPDDAQEIKKQAQTRYLAARLKKRETSVRKFVDLAWAEAGKREKLDPELLIAIIQKESAFRPTVQSSYGAQGLMQVVRRWHHDKLRPSESLFDPEVNIRVGADVLEEYLASADGNLDHALRKYSGNAPGYVKTIKKESRALGRIAEQAASKVLVAQG